MGFISKLFGKKEEATSNISIQIADANPQNEISLTSDIPTLQGDYAKTVFLWAHEKASSVKSNDSYAKYFLYECGISDPVKYHKDLIAQGYFVEAPISDVLDSFKVTDLKQILVKMGKSTTGKKDVLIERIAENISDELINEVCPNKMYVLSEIARIFLQEHQNYVLVHKYKTNWGIDWHEFDANYRPGLSFYDVAWSIFNRRVLEDTHNFGRNGYLNMYQLLVEEKKRERAFEMLLRVIYIDLSGVCDYNSQKLYSSGVYTKKQLYEHFDIAIMLAPGLVKDVPLFSDIYNDVIIDKLYEQKLPVQVCDKDLFRSIILSILDGSYDENKVREKLEQAYKKVVEAL